jgi:predicted N-formylglutamate amidohydrolase
MRPVTLPGRGTGAALVLTCEHASNSVPAEFGRLGLSLEQLGDHIAWDIGAAAIAEELNRQVGAPAVLSAASRLIVDCNRDLSDSDLIAAESHGVLIPGNAVVDTRQRAERLERYYAPYHDAVDAELVHHPDAVLLSVHSFTPSLNGRERPFDVGVLFDDFEDVAGRLARDLRASGLTVRLNEPYSALDGLIFSARTHGRRHDLRYFELEVNNRLLRHDADIRRVARQLLDGIENLVAETPRAALA